ncbi:hypothetical protein, partial [Herbaspirillum sp. B65]|uniref:hypothetical protein n=1 Tax=Herbaspirillum sp. B65 TaxID=137708 RepID=UPI001C254D24
SSSHAYHHFNINHLFNKFDINVFSVGHLHQKGGGCCQANKENEEIPNRSWQESRILGGIQP